MGRLEGRVAIVTGGASGIGLACATRFAMEGAIVVGSDLEKKAGWSAVEEHCDRAALHCVDVRDEDAQSELAKQVASEHGRIDILVTAAGTPGGGPVHLLPVEEWQRVQDINLKGTFLSCKSVLPTMLEQRSGSIITIASIEGLEGTEGGSAYNASKGGVVLLTKNMAIDYARVGIRVNAICPGFIETPMLQGVLGMEQMAKYAERIKAHHKMQRFGRPEEIAGAACFFASDDSSFVTGQALAVDGGFTSGLSVGIVEMMGLT